MIKQEIYLEKYDWNVIVCHVANQEDVDEAMDLLSSIDCKGQPLLDAYDHISTDFFKQRIDIHKCFKENKCCAHLQIYF